MPLFDAYCKKCNETFERFQKYNSTEPLLCEICGYPLDKVVSGGNFVLKGENWAKKKGY